MKKPFSPVVAASLIGMVLVGELSSACFSSMNSSMGGHSSPGTTAAAAALDVVTLPVQVPMYIVGSAEAANRNAANAQFASNKAKALAALKKDPSVVLSWKFEANVQTPEYAAFTEALKDSSIKFTDDELRQVVQQSPWLGEAVFSRAAVTEALIRSIFADELAKDNQGQPSAMRAIVVSPQMPDDLLIEVIQKAPKYIPVVFARRNCSEAVIRAAFDDELQKDVRGEHSAISDMIRSPKMPTDLLNQVALANLPRKTDSNLARQELLRRATVNPR